MQSAKEDKINRSNQNENKNTNLNWAEEQNLNPNSVPMNGTQYAIPAYYNAPYPYPAYAVPPEGNNNWSNGEPIPYMRQLNPDCYSVDYTNAYTAQYGNTTQVTTGYNHNYYAGNPAYSNWNRNTDYYANGAYSGVTQAVQSMQISSDKNYPSYTGEKKISWASIAKQPAKPVSHISTSGVKKKGPGMPPLPVIPRKSIITADLRENKLIKAQPPTLQFPPDPVWSRTIPPPNVPPPSIISSMAYPPHPTICPVQSIPTVIPSVTMEKKKSPSPPPQSLHRITLKEQMVAFKEQRIPPKDPNPHLRISKEPSTQLQFSKEPSPQVQFSKEPSPQLQFSKEPSPQAQFSKEPSPQLQFSKEPSPPLQFSKEPSPPKETVKEPAVLDKLKDKNNYNPTNFDVNAEGARFFVIKSYSEDDIHRSIKYEIWCSTERGNKRLDEAFNERKNKNGMVYLLFSVNGSGHFCGMAKMMSSVDYGSSSTIWAQDKWKGQFKVHWIYVKDVPNSRLRHIRLENNDNKPVSNSRDTQEVPHDKGVEVLKIIHTYPHTTSIFDDFVHYEKRQLEDTTAKKNTSSSSTSNNNSYQNKSKEYPFKNKEWEGFTNHNRNWSGRGRGYNNNNNHQGSSSNNRNFLSDRKY